MIHQMKLKAVPFEMIENGTKTVELRLNDEKRQQIRVGDCIQFTLMDSDRTVLTKVTALHKFNSFAQLFSVIPKEKYGFKSDETVPSDYMDEYYTPQEQKKYGVLGIEISKVDTNVNF